MKITTATQLLKHMRARLPTAGGPKRSGRVTPAGRNEMKNAETCQLCKYWKRRTAISGGECMQIGFNNTGYCRRYPPTRQGWLFPEITYPITWQSNMCGEFAPILSPQLLSSQPAETPKA